jgi:hypothetical protein
LSAWKKKKKKSAGGDEYTVFWMFTFISFFNVAIVAIYFR